jgi:lactoylglutathione lyase
MARNNAGEAKMIDFRNIYHTGVIVQNLEQAMTFYTQSMAVTWAPIHIYNPLRLWSPAKGMDEITLRVCYSREGPLHIELIEAVPGTFYDPAINPDAKHIGLFMDDVGAEVERLSAIGWEVLAAKGTPEQRYGEMAYLLAPEGKMVIELVSNTIRQRILDWFEEPDEMSPRYV